MHGDGADALGQVVHAVLQAGQALLALAQHPGLVDVDVAVAVADELPDLRKRQGELQLVHVLFDDARQGLKALAQGHVGFVLGFRCGHLAAEVLLDHGNGAAHQVAQVVDQIGVHAGQQRLVGVVAVRAEGHLAHEVVAQRVHAVALHDGRGVDHVALGLAHLVVAEQQPAVAEHLLGQLKSQRVEHDRPVDRMEAHDLLAHQVHVRGPVLIEQRGIVAAVAQGGDVVGQRVDPDVDHVLGIEVHRHAPLEGGAADAQILKARAQEVVQHLVGPRRRLDEVGMALDVVDQPVLILAHAEEVALLVGGLAGAAAVGAEVALLQLGGGPEGLALGAVLALVFALVDVALVVELLEDLLHDLLVALVGGADEVVVLDVHQLPQILGLRHDLVHELLGGHARVGGLALDLLAVLVGAGEEVGVIARHLLEAGHGVRRDGGVGVADVHVSRGIIDRRGDVEFRLFALIAHVHVPS